MGTTYDPLNKTEVKRIVSVLYGEPSHYLDEELLLALPNAYCLCFSKERLQTIIGKYTTPIYTPDNIEDALQKLSELDLSGIDNMVIMGGTEFVQSIMEALGTRKRDNAWWEGLRLYWDKFLAILSPCNIILSCDRSRESELEGKYGPSLPGLIQHVARKASLVGQIIDTEDTQLVDFRNTTSQFGIGTAVSDMKVEEGAFDKVIKVTLASINVFSEEVAQAKEMVKNLGDTLTMANTVADIRDIIDKGKATNGTVNNTLADLETKHIQRIAKNMLNGANTKSKLDKAMKIVENEGLSATHHREVKEAQERVGGI